MGDVIDTAARVRSGSSSAADVVSACIKRIKTLDSLVNALVSYDEDRAQADAARIDKKRANGESLGKLAGVPVVVKDNICTEFSKTTCGSKILESYVSQSNAFVVDQLLAADAVIVGKANLDEFAMGSSTEFSFHGGTLNPWNTQRVPGGSSGGPAVAVASRMALASLGSDTGGSIRQPASFCGVVGLKPSYGRVSRYGLVAYGSSLDQIGPFATSVDDAALMLEVIAGHDDRDTTSVDQDVPAYSAALDQPMDGKRIGVCSACFAEGLSKDVRKSVESAIEKMRDAGCEIVPIELLHMKYAIASYYMIAMAEASSNLARFDGAHYGYRTEKPRDLTQMYASSRGEGFGAEVKRRIMMGTYALSSGYYDAYYLKALKVRRLIKEDFDKAYQRCDVIALPVAPTTAFAVGEKVEDPLAMYLSDMYTVFANLAGLCAISLPCGFDDAGLPIGWQLMGPPLGEMALLSVAHQYQTMTDFHRQTPALAAQ